MARENERAAWAHKMAAVLDAPVGTRGSGATPGGSGGSGAATGRPTSLNGQPPGGGPNGGPAPKSGGTDAPRAASPATAVGAPTGSSARQFAEQAKTALGEVKLTVALAKQGAAEGKKFLSDAQAGKQQAQDAQRQAQTIAASIPASAPVPAPQGQDPKAQYDAAIQISGQVKAKCNEVTGQSDDVYDQMGEVEVGRASVEAAADGAEANSERLKKFSDQVASQTEVATAAAASAATAAAESKKKAEQAAKENAENKDALAKAAAAADGFVKAAKQSASSAQAAAREAATTATNADANFQRIDAIRSETNAVVDATTKIPTTIREKLKPHNEAVSKAECQEFEYRRKLEEHDAEEVLRKRYEALGGDPELTAAMAAEDKAFESSVETHRAEIKKWQEKRKRELDAHKADIEDVVNAADSFMPAVKKWLKEAEPPTDLKASVKQLGEKLKTERGRELVHEIDQRVARIDRGKHVVEFNEKVVKMAKASLETINKQYEKLDHEYEASEAVIKEQRTELDNLLQMDAMSLEEKVDYLQCRPQPVRDKFQKGLDRELDRIVKLTLLQDSNAPARYHEQYQQHEPTPIDWSSVEAQVQALRDAKLEDLQSSETDLAEIRKEYEAAGGDAALLAKRVAAWQEKVQSARRADNERVGDYQNRSQRLRRQFTDADTRWRNLQGKYDGYRIILTSSEKQLEELNRKIDPSVPFKDFTPEEQAEYTLLQREIKRVKALLNAGDAEVRTAKESRDAARKLVDQERQRHDQVMDDDRHHLPKPTSSEIYKMPLSAKYPELTGKTMP